jgi:hypothetical protein
MGSTCGWQVIAGRPLALLDSGVSFFNFFDFFDFIFGVMRNFLDILGE